MKWTLIIRFHSGLSQYLPMSKSNIWPTSRSRACILSRWDSSAHCGRGWGWCLCGWGWLGLGLSGWYDCSGALVCAAAGAGLHVRGAALFLSRWLPSQISMALPILPIACNQLLRAFSLKIPPLTAVSNYEADITPSQGTLKVDRTLSKDTSKGLGTSSDNDGASEDNHFHLLLWATSLNSSLLCH